MLDNIAPHTFDNQFDPTRRADRAHAALYADADGVRVLDELERLMIPTCADYSDDTRFCHLFTLDGEPWFLADQPPRTALRALSSRVLRQRGDVPAHWLLALSVASHLERWYAQSRFCGACGAQTRHSQIERAMVCTSCGSLRYPSVAPAVIVAVTRGDTLLLARGKQYGGTFYSLIAGYVEAGERIESAACREVYEETGLHVSHLSYFGSQPWPFSGALMIGYFAEAEPDEPLHLQESEIADAAFYHAESFPVTALRCSIAGAMIEAFKKGERPHGGDWAV